MLTVFAHCNVLRTRLATEGRCCSVCCRFLSVFMCLRLYACVCVYVFMCVCVLCLYAECVMSLTLSCLGGWWVGGGWGWTWTRVSVSKRHNIRKHPDTDISPACTQHAFYTRGYKFHPYYLYSFEIYRQLLPIGEIWHNQQVFKGKTENS